MKTLQTLALVVLMAASVDAVEMTVLQADGTPAAGAVYYRSHLRAPGYGAEMGMGEMGGMEMMMGGGGGYEESSGETQSDYGGMDAGYGDMMDMGMGSDDYMGESGIMGANGNSSDAHLVLTLLNGHVVKPRHRMSFDEIAADKEGRVDLDNRIRVQRGVKQHAMPSLVIHSSGISFFPRGTKFSPQVKLRSVGQLVVETPTGVDPEKYQVLTCWQNGFAYPSLDGYLAELGPSQKIGNRVDASDWRFTPRFRIYQTAKFNTPINVPPGEVRVTIIPSDSTEDQLTKKTPAKLFQLLVSGGPSTIALATAPQETPQRVEFPALRTLRCRIPEKSESTLPDWGDEPQRVYRIEPFRRIAAGDIAMLSTPEAKDVSSRQSVVDFLHRMRSERAAYQTIRKGTPVDKDHVQFDLLRPGFYIVNRYDQDGNETRALPVVNWDHRQNTAIGRLADRKIKGVDGAFELREIDRGKSTFVSDPAIQKVLQQQSSGKKSDAEKLRLVKSLRSELDQTIQRLVAQRRRLVAIEIKLTGKTVDPFADPGAGMPAAGGDPFGGADPFGGSSSDPDPFRGDPFGGKVPGNDSYSEPINSSAEDPFNPKTGTDKSPSLGSDPFGDPF